MTTTAELRFLILILTPEDDLYLRAVVLSLATAPLAVAIHLQMFLGLGGTRSFWWTYGGVLSVVCCIGLWLVDAAGTLRVPRDGVLGMILVGLACGVVAFYGDSVIVRSVSRWRQRNRFTSRVAPSRKQPSRRVHSDPLTRAGPVGLRGSAGYLDFGSDSARTATLGLIGGLEELVYRGVLLSLILTIPGFAFRLSAVIALITLFALSHSVFGWVHVLAKLLLSALTTLVAIVASSVVPAILAHVVFNVMVARQVRLTTAGRRP